jgi:hypothetical protein
MSERTTQLPATLIMFVIISYTTYCTTKEKIKIIIIIIFIIIIEERFGVFSAQIVDVIFKGNIFVNQDTKQLKILCWIFVVFLFTVYYISCQGPLGVGLFRSHCKQDGSQHGL